MRIVSLLPAATELVVALEQRYALVGRTHECDHPPAIADVPSLTTDLLPAGMSPVEIDAAVSDGMAIESTIYRLDTTAFADARPEVVITQQTCAVCAVDGAQVARAVTGLESPARIISYDPHRLADLPIEAERIGRELGDTRAGLALRSHMETRIRFVAEKVQRLDRPRVAAVEWPEPLFAPGHWVPDIIEAAGATSVFGVAGERSVTRTWDELAAAQPDILVLSFCGFHLDAVIEHAAPLIADGIPAATGASRIVAIDGSAWLSRPGPRLIDAIEALAWIFHGAHPDLRPESSMAAELRDGVWVDAAATAGISR